MAIEPKFKLKPCPFCGGKAEYDNCDLGSGKWYQCIDCGARIKRPYGTPDKELRSDWNRRVEIK